ncbi:hypothetical protein EIM50_20565 [Pseudoxanthomonas sp. SGD-10]|nr:hypothetical protein EIM50_20565 [Pseudoxanthomonas sp. SGD-10]
MGTIRHGANGGFSGKAGSVIGSSWRNIDYIKGLPKKRSIGPSEKQLAQQAKFAYAVEFLQPIKDLLNIGFADSRRGKSTGYNIALRELIKNAVTGDYPDYEIDYSRVQISVGSLAQPFASALQANAPATIKVSWDYIANAMGSYQADKAVILLYNQQKKVHLVLAEQALRSEGEQAIEVPVSFTGDELSVWLFFINSELKKQSKSVYSGSINVI